MANIRYSGDIFNLDVKEKFLQKYGDGTQKTIRHLFRMTYDYERLLNIDLYNFTLEQIDDIFTSPKKQSKLSTVRSNLSNIAKYFEWAAEHNLTDINPFESLNIREYAVKYFNDKVGTNFLTLNEVEEIEDACLNYQDSVIIRMLWEGFSGREFSELLNLKLTDMDKQSRTALLIDGDQSTRVLSISERCISMIEEAVKQEVYFRPSRIEGKLSKLNFITNDTVLKLVRVGRTHMEAQPDIHLIYRRLRSIPTKSGVVLTPKLIDQSGMVHILSSYSKNSGVELKEFLSSVCLKYGIYKIDDDEDIKYKRMFIFKDFLLEHKLDNINTPDL